MLCAIFYLKISDEDRFASLKENVENDYVLNKAEYSRNITGVQSLFLNYQNNYNYIRQFQYQGVSNQHMLHSMENLGLMNVKQKRINKLHEETLTTSPEIIVREKFTMR